MEQKRKHAARRGKAARRSAEPASPAALGIDDEWTVERLVPGGDGFLHLPDGRAAFAPGALPGDRIRVRAVQSHGSWLRAAQWELVAPGPDRIPPPCPIAEDCGGCDWMHLAREAELGAKASILREALARTGGFRDVPPALPIVSRGADLGYRGRLRLHLDEAGRLGLFARESHRLVEITACPVSDPGLERALGVLRAAAARHPGALGTWSELELRVAPGGPPVSVLFEPRPDRSPNAASAALLEDLGRELDVAVSGAQAGTDQRWPLPGGVELHAPPAAFTQVNWAVNQALVEAVVEGARSRQVARFLDLYCGAGNFTLPLLAAGLAGLGVDHAGAGIRAARRAARAAQLSDEGFVAAAVQGEVQRLVRRREPFDLVLLDPPRSGAKEVLALVAELGAPHLAVCSCDPVTLARDLAQLARAGYTLDGVCGFDMFPHTHHVEALAWMRRTGAERPQPE